MNLNLDQAVEPDEVLAARANLHSPLDEVDELPAVDVDEVLAAMATLKAVCPLPELADCLGVDPDALETALASLLDDGLLESWKRTSGPSGSS